ncbi:MAG TPA: S53 family peptidase [Ktedonobacteraceae bacterium]|nr:S53 family peptidase [Ktedonobacteraceae bacterium]
MHFKSRAGALLVLLLLLTACVSQANNINVPNKATPSPTKPIAVAPEPCPDRLSQDKSCFTPRDLRIAYDVEALTTQGFTGKGQTIVDIVSYGSPTLQQDMDIFSKQFGLPPIQIQVISPIGTVPFDAKNQDMTGWAEETELDVQLMHAIAPDAGIVVLTSPVDETEGTIGMPEFMKLEQYAVDHHLGQIFSQSFVASEATLADGAGQQLVKSFTDFYHQITTQQGWTIVSGSGDNGATDWADLAATKLATTQTVNFPADVPWVTAVGGTSLHRITNGYNEQAWPGSGGGVSKFFDEPDYQRAMPQSVQTQLATHRGIPDIAADADPGTGMAFYIAGRWLKVGGTSASTPLWAGIIAIANQVAGHPLGFINPGIYKVAASQQANMDFRDITAGNNNVNAPIQVQGFQAISGWDAVTGWGAPQASHLIPDLIAALK